MSNYEDISFGATMDGESLPAHGGMAEETRLRRNPNSQASFIGGGTVNHIGSNALGANGVAQGVISGGSGNCIDSSPATFTQGAAIGGGNIICIGPGGNFSAIAGGEQNSIWGVGNSMGGGVQNTIGNFSGALPAQGSFIGGGYFNCIDSNAAGTFYGAIGGGQSNWICAGVNFGSIFGGQNNSVNDNCTSILGGANNTIPTGFPNAHIVGSNIVLGVGAGNPNSLHVNNLWFDPTTIFSYSGWPAVGLPSGTVYIDTSTSNTLRMNP